VKEEQDEVGKEQSVWSKRKTQTRYRKNEKKQPGVKQESKVQQNYI